MRRRRSISPLVAVGLSAVALSAPAHADRIGTAGAVNVSSRGEPPGGETRVIEIGAQVVENERIRTSDTGSVQVLFVDKTTLNVGPNSNLVIDRFVYSPVANRGQVALSLGKGVLRVVGGLATHTDGATINTIAASIGVRGGIATIKQGPTGTEAILGFGHMTVTTVCSGGAGCTPRTVVVSRPGYGVFVAGPNEPPSAPSRVSAQELALLSGQLGSRGGQTGGTDAQPTDTQAAAYQIGTPTSPVAPIPNTAAARRANALAAIGTATQQTVQQAAQVGASVRTSQTVAVQQVLASRASTPSTPSTPVTPVTPPVTPGPTTTYAILTNGPYSTSSGPSPVPYLTGAFAGTGSFTVSPVLGYQKGGYNANGTPDTTSRQFQAGLSVTGQGSSQSATLFVMTSEIKNSPNIGYTQGGGFTAVTMRNGSAGSEWYGLGYGAVSSATPTSAPNTVPNVNGTPNASYTLNNATTNLDSGTVTNSQSDNFGSPAYSFNPITTGTPTLTASNHPNLTLNGYVGGVMATASASGYTTPYIVTNVSGSPGDVSIYLPGNSSEMGAVFNVASVNPPTNGLTTATYAFGSYNPADPNNTAGLNTARGAYVNPSNFAGRAASVYDNGANVPVSTRDSQPVGDSDQMMVTASSVGANTSTFLTSISSATVNPCNCDLTQWGFWSSFNGANDSSGNLVYEDQGVLLLWVAGVPTTAGALPASGTATYSPGGFSYLAAGTFQNIVNFGARTGAVTIGSLDGATYTGTVNLTPATTQFGGAITGPNSLGRTATLAGSFFQGGPTNTTPAYGEMGGSLTLTGTGYLGSGIFVARKP
jgi:hypothetical protein